MLRAEVAAAASVELRSAMRDLPLVTVDRFGSFGRNVYASRAPVDALRPHLVVSYSRAWAEPQPDVCLSIDRAEETRSRSRKHDFLADQLSEALATIDGWGGNAVVLAWSDDDDARRLAGPHGVLLAVPRQCRHSVESKSKLSAILSSAGVPEAMRIPAITTSPGVASPWDDVTRQLGDVVVVQDDWSEGGRGTRFVRDPGEFDCLVASASSPLRISRFVDGIAGGVAALTVPRGASECDVFVDSPTQKGTDISQLGIGPAKGAGNDWSLVLDARSATDLVGAMESLGRYLFRAHGLVGMWNVGVIHGPTGPVINEINGRLAGGSETAAVHEAARGCVPSLAAHACVLLGRTPSWLPSAQSYNAASIELSQTARKRAPFYLKMRNPLAVALAGTPRMLGSGVYGRVGAGLEFRRRGGSSLDLADDEVLLADAIEPGMKCLPGADLCKIEGVQIGASFYEGAHRLSTHGVELVTAVHTLFDSAQGSDSPRR